MKRYLILLSSVLLALLIISIYYFITAQTYKKQVFSLMRGIITTEINVDNDVIDLGTRRINDTIGGVFSLTNVGEIPLNITDIHPDCSCTVMSYDKAPILKGEKKQIWIKYNPKFRGYFESTLYLYANIKKSPKVLKFKVRIK